MKRSNVRPSVRPFVCLSHRSTAAAACGGFAAERPAARIYHRFLRENYTYTARVRYF